jgi:hypothetical protein
VVVRFDFHDDAEAIADVHGAGVLSAAVGEHIRAFSREQAEKRLRVLVAAVLAPERPEEAKLDFVRFTAELLDDQLVLRAGEGDGVEDGLVDRHGSSIPKRVSGRIDGSSVGVCKRNVTAL